MTRNEAGSGRAMRGERWSAGRLIGPVCWVFLLSFMVFLPVRGCIHDAGSPGDRYGYGRRYDLSQIGMAISRYAAENGDRLPPTLAALYPVYIDHPRVLVCPGDVETPIGDEWASRYIYMYEGGGDWNPLPPDAPIVVYPYRTGGGDVRFTILYADGSVRTHWSAAAVERYLAGFEQGDRR